MSWPLIGMSCAGAPMKPEHPTPRLLPETATERIGLFEGGPMRTHASTRAVVRAPDPRRGPRTRSRPGAHGHPHRDRHGRAGPAAARRRHHRDQRGHGPRPDDDERHEGRLPGDSLAPGSYTVRVELASFRTEERKHRVLSATTRLSLSPFRLVVGLGESVVVEASGTEVSTEDSQHTGLITSTQIGAAPGGCPPDRRAPVPGA